MLRPSLLFTQASCGRRWPATIASIPIYQNYPHTACWRSQSSLQHARQGAAVLVTPVLPAHDQLVQATSQPPSALDEAGWAQECAPLLAKLGLSSPCRPEQLWQHLQTLGSTCEQQQQALRQHLDLSSCRLLLLAAAASCEGSRQQQEQQQQLNQLWPVIHAASSMFPAFTLDDFQLLLQVCAGARYVPDKEWLAALIYADSGGFERLLPETQAAQLVHLFSDLAAVFASHNQLLADTQRKLKQQQQQLQATAPVLQGKEAAEVAALQAALQTSSTNLKDIYHDQLLAGELSAVAGYWLIRKLLPAVAQQQAAGEPGGSGDAAALVLSGLLALPGLRYQVLDGEDADVLLRLLGSQLQHWSSSQLAAALTSALPCLGPTPPTDGALLAVLFAAAGAAAGGMTNAEAGRLLVVLEQLPVFAPDPQVAQKLLDQALNAPLQLSSRQLYQLLSSAQALGAVPRPEHMALLQQVLSS